MTMRTYFCTFLFFCLSIEKYYDKIIIEKYNKREETIEYMKKFVKSVFGILIVLAIGAVAGYVISCFLGGYNKVFPLKTEYLFASPTYITLGLLSLFILIYILNKSTNEHYKGSSEVGSSRKGRTETGEEKEAYFSARLITKKELKTNKDFHFCYFSTLKDNKFDGIPLRAERVGNHTEINMQKPIHTITSLQV